MNVQNYNVIYNYAFNECSLLSSITQVTVAEAERRDNEKLYNRMTVKEIKERIPGVRK